jgi:hypothetical protein
MLKISTDVNKFGMEQNTTLGNVSNTLQVLTVDGCRRVFSDQYGTNSNLI